MTSTAAAFALLAGTTTEHISGLIEHEQLFKDYETGRVSDEGFRTGLRVLLAMEATDEEIDKAWNAMLLDLPVARIELLKRLGNQYRIFLLSNTNQIHVDAFNKILYDAVGYEDLCPLFEVGYYSHLINLRKPNTDIFEFVLKENGLEASETLFIDDNGANIAGADSVGIHTLHVVGPDTLINYFDEQEI